MRRETYAVSRSISTNLKVLRIASVIQEGVMTAMSGANSVENVTIILEVATKERAENTLKKARSGATLTKKEVILTKRTKQ